MNVQAQLDLDFSVHDEKLAVNLLVMSVPKTPEAHKVPMQALKHFILRLQQKEGALLLEPRYIREDLACEVT